MQGHEPMSLNTRVPTSIRPPALRRAGLAALLLAPALFLARSASAQTGSISGTVVDTKGDPAGFVDVSLEGQKNPNTATDTTDDKGTFHFPAVKVGTYKLTVFSMGLVFQSIA